MAIREELMCYFKGDCVRRLVERTNVEINQVDVSLRGRPNYERVAITNQQRTILSLSRVPIALLTKYPDRIVLQANILRRSPQLRQVDQGLREFMAEFLPGVIVEESEGGIDYATD